MRLFIAVALSEAVRDCLVSSQARLYDLGVRGNYTSRENLHITIAFIGEFSDPDVVLDALSSVIFTPIPITLRGLGSFGNLWWAGITGSPALEALSRKVRRALNERGIPFDRKKFSAHITLLRRASIVDIPPVTLDAVSMSIDKISLFRSDRGKRGMIYTELGRIYAQSLQI